jgi:hypothetical protein
LVLYEDEEAGDTHMAIYIRAKGPGIDLDLFRWKNGGNTVDEVNAYGLGNASDPQEVTVMMTGRTAVIVEGYADEDQDWPSYSWPTRTPHIAAAARACGSRR